MQLLKREYKRKKSKMAECEGAVGSQSEDDIGVHSFFNMSYLWLYFCIGRMAEVRTPHVHRPHGGESMYH